MSDVIDGLVRKKCAPCEGGVAPMTEAQIGPMLKGLTGWQHIDPGLSPMCGNSICQDRRFMARCMPKLEAYFHYRNLDVSTLKELAKRWRPGLAEGFKKGSKHEALADIYESIEELKYYREHFIQPSILL